MAESHSHNRGHSRRSELIALLLSDLVDCVGDRDALRETLRTAPSETRLLVCIPDASASPLLRAIAGVHVDKQFLLGHEVEKPETPAVAVKAPPGMSRDDLVEFALALSDAVLVSSDHKEQRWAQHANKRLGKPLVTVGLPLHRLSSELLDVASGLDPDAPGWRRWLGRHGSGRLEQGLLEFLALWPWDGERRKNKFLRSFRLGWRPVSYVPVCWQKSCPDEAMAAKHSRLAKRFEAMDLSALYGSYKHRDTTWAAHLGVAFAVLFAIFGYISEHHLRFSFAELLSLLVATLVIWARHTKLQERWTACRLGAEQLRIAGMALPLLVLPRALATKDIRNPGDDKVDYEFSALADVKRTVREQGLPQVDYSSLPADEAARWLRLIVADQIEYHERNQQTLERAETSLNLISTAIFFASIVAVALPVIVWLLFLSFPSLLSHAGMQFLLPLLGHPDPRFLILSAALPAVVAALHGAGVRLGFVHRTALSRDMKKELTDIAQALDALIRSAASSTSAWHKVRALAYRAAEAMGAESTSWHRLVRRYRDEIP
jgi:hypothetical protein